MNNLEVFFRDIAEKRVSDAFFIAGLPPVCKLNGKFHHMEEKILMPEQTAVLVDQLYQMTGGRSREKLEQNGEDDFAFSLPGISRFRASVYRQRGSLAAVIRVIAFDLPDPETIHIPEDVMDLSQLTGGMLLVAGSAGSGKSTTIACLIDRINRTREGHIITLEDPVEYLHKHRKSIVSQREIGEDTSGYVPALRAALRQAPDVILLGEMRDYDTIRTAITAAETGHLVISTLHTTGAAGAVERIVDVFPPDQQDQVRLQLSMVLRAVVSQQLVKTESKGILPVFEVMRVNTAVSNLIRENRVHQLEAVMQSSREQGMYTMDSELLRLYREGIIGQEELMRCCSNREQIEKKLEKR